jgi:hypothetical protein
LINIVFYYIPEHSPLVMASSSDIRYVRNYFSYMAVNVLSFDLNLKPSILDLKPSILELKPSYFFFLHAAETHKRTIE